MVKRDPQDNIKPHPTASLIGWIISAQNELATPIIGIKPNPTKNNPIEVSHTSPISMIPVINPIEPIESAQIRIYCSLYFPYLSRRMPWRIDPEIPETINTTPKILLSVDEYPNFSVITLTAAPRVL